MKLPDSLNLHVLGRLSETDALRQECSAKAILKRFECQPGVILGDEVGMGKTFVALAVAAAHVMQDASRPVVIMVPGGVVKKWGRDSNTFKSECLRSAAERERFRVKLADTGIEFLKLLDDPCDVRASVIVLAHGALNRRLGDCWAKLAVLQAAIKGRHGVDDLRTRISRHAAFVLRMGSRVSEALVHRLLDTPAADWKSILVKHHLLDDNADDPVPELFVSTLKKLDLSEVYEKVVEKMPVRASKHLDLRLRDAANTVNNAGTGVLPPVWRNVLANMELSLPLLILDEAHRARHGGTQLAQLLRESREDLDTVGGPLAQRFDRMLFLTATPFQLGHHELCNVLSRFKAIAWQGSRAPRGGRDEFQANIAALNKALNTMQVATERLERDWKRLLAPDFDEAVRVYGERWWASAREGSDPLCVHIDNHKLRAVMLAFAAAEVAIRDAEEKLRPWVLRSVRSRFLPPPHGQTVRRERLEGAAVLGEVDAGAGLASGGLRVGADNALPFLLAARINSLDDGGRVFGDGLASSFEALLDTHREPDAAMLAVDQRDKVADESWHLAKLRDCAASLGPQGRSLHPKVRATINLAMALWRGGEKVVIFCHYRHTGRALHRYFSEAMLEEIQIRAAEKLRCPPEDVDQALKRFIDRLDRDRAGEVVAMVDALLKRHPALHGSKYQRQIEDVVLRFLRTPTFLVRFADLSDRISAQEWIRTIFDCKDRSGVALGEVLSNFFAFLADRCGEQERAEYLEALGKIQTGSHAGAEVDASFGGDEIQPGERSRLVANVRRVYGDTRDETRDRIMLTFNTPFYPEILIASSVMAEGVDLHLNCRHVIHHDLDWNPSALEQRTGRIDRLGSKAESSGHSIRVYLPYVEGCQDEKLFRVVMDRERWFGVVMGAEESMKRVLSTDTWELERMAEQPLVPMEMVDALKLNLDAA